MALVHPLKWSYRRCNRFARRSAANLWRAGIPGRPKKRRIHLRNAQPVNRIQRLAFFTAFCVAWFNAAVGRPVERTGAAGQTPSPTQRVLVLYSDERLLPANIIIDEAIRAAFAVGTNNRVEFYSEFLDVSRFPGEEQQQRHRDFLRNKYRERPPDLVIAVSGGALVFLVEHRADLFTGVPIVYCSVAGDLHLDHLSDARTAEVTVPDSVAPTLEMLLRLHPDTRQVAVVSGSGPRDRQMADTFRQEMTTFGNRVAFTWLTNLSMEELRGRLSRLPDHTVVLYITMFQDAAGKTFTPRQALEAFAPASRAPIYGFYDTYLGHGIVGGSMMAFEQIGRKAAQLGIRILAGEDAQSAARSESYQAVPMFDWHQLRRWNISEQRLPPASIIRFKEATYWEQNYRIIVTALSLCLLEALLIVALLVQLRRSTLDLERWCLLQPLAQSRSMTYRLGGVGCTGKLASTRRPRELYPGKRESSGRSGFVVRRVCLREMGRQTVAHGSRVGIRRPPRRWNQSATSGVTNSSRAANTWRIPGKDYSRFRTLAKMDL